MAVSDIQFWMAEPSVHSFSLRISTHVLEMAQLFSFKQLGK